MNRNYFVADPDALTVSTQVVDDQAWHGGQKPLTLDEAKVSIALAAVAGGMFEIGDDLPTLGSSPDRMALVKNRDLINMARLGHASIPIDLMSYGPGDQQPSIFLLKQDKRQTILTVFNWTEKAQTRKIDLSSLGLKDVRKISNYQCAGRRVLLRHELIHQPELHSAAALGAHAEIDRHNRARASPRIRCERRVYRQDGRYAYLQRNVFFRESGGEVSLGFWRWSCPGWRGGNPRLHAARHLHSAARRDGPQCSNELKEPEDCNFR